MRTAKLYNFVPVCRQKIRLRLSAQFPNGHIPERRAGGGGDIRQIGERRPRASPSRRNGNAVTRRTAQPSPHDAEHRRTDDRGASIDGEDRPRDRRRLVGD